MHHWQAQDRGGTERAARGPERTGAPAAAGGGAAGVESQVIELKTRVDGLETVSRRAEDRWEKWRTDQVEMRRDQAAMKKEMAEMKREQVELRKEQTELRKEQTELRKEMGAGFQRLVERMDAGFKRADARMDAGFKRADEKMDAGFKRTDERFEALIRELAASTRRADEKLQKVTDQLTRKFILRLEMIAGLILAAILGTGIFG